jgi:magnesium-transporting ATPase (P-type)
VLEALAGVQVVSFDKTGTLTRGRCQARHYSMLRCRGLQGAACMLHVCQVRHAATVTPEYSRPQNASACVGFAR